MAAQVLSPGQVIETPIVSNVPEPYQENLNVVLMCPECRENPPNLVEASAEGDLVCGSCGLVLGDRIIDTRSEWRTFANDDGHNEDPSRVGAASDPLMETTQMGTNIALSDSQHARGLQRAHARANMDKDSKTLKEGFALIIERASQMQLAENTVRFAQDAYRRIKDDSLLRGKSTSIIISGCLVIACRTTGSQRSFKDIHRTFGVTKKELGRAFKLVEEALKRNRRHGGHGDSNINADELAANAHATLPSELVLRYCDQLVMSQNASRVTKLLAEKMQSIDALAGRSPLSAAAACIYMASYLMNDPRSPKAIAEKVHVSDSTIRNAYKLLYAVKDQVIDPAWNGDVKKLPPAPA